jgi:hypothetical protein
MTVRADSTAAADVPAVNPSPSHGSEFLARSLKLRGMKWLRAF